MQTITLIYGDGIGKEVIASAKAIVEASGAKVDWEVQEAGAEAAEKYGKPIDDAVLESISRNGVALKGPTATPIGKGFRSVNVEIRKRLDLYVNLRPLRSFEGVKSLYQNIDLTIVRENTEGLYIGIEKQVDEGRAEATKVITKKASDRIVKYAFDYAKDMGKKKVIAIHKANIMKCTDGMFLRIAREIAPEYPEIEFDDMIIDALCMRLVQDPSKFDVMVMPNLYGDIVSDLCAGLVGGPGLAPSANVGHGKAIFEAVHGSAPQIAGQNIANPTALILSGAMMLCHIGEAEAAAKIENAVSSIIEEGKELTTDLGGTLGTKEYAEALIKKITA